MITCSKCFQAKPDEEYHSRSHEAYRAGKRRTVCKECSAAQQRINYLNHKKNSFFKLRATRSKAKAKEKGVPYDLDPEYLESIWTGTCPVFGVVLDRSGEEGNYVGNDSPELDRFTPSLGYVKGNVAWISRRANRIKQDATQEELENLVKWMKER